MRFLLKGRNGWNTEKLSMCINYPLCPNDVDMVFRWWRFLNTNQQRINKFISKEFLYICG